MSILVQNIIVGLIVLGAVAYIALTVRRALTAKKGCGCGSGKACHQAKVPAHFRKPE